MATALQTGICFSFIPPWQKRQSPVVQVNVLWIISVFIYIYFYLFLDIVQCKIGKPAWECEPWSFFSSFLTTRQWYEESFYLPFWFFWVWYWLQVLNQEITQSFTVGSFLEIMGKGGLSLHGEEVQNLRFILFDSVNGRWSLPHETKTCWKIVLC